MRSSYQPSAVSRQLRVDYDRLAPGYDKRYEVDRLEGIARELRRVGEGRERVLEVGCGTGRWLGEFSPGAFGADRSPGMLAKAGSARVAAARANDLPFRPETFDLIYVVNAVHHFDDARAFVVDAAKLLRPGGALSITGMDPRLTRHYFPEFFAGVRERDLERYPSFGALADWMLVVGLHPIELRLAQRVHRSYLGREVWGDPFLNKGSNSQLALLTDSEYAEGRRRIEEEIVQSEAEGEVAVFRSELDFWVLTGFRS